MVLLQTHITHQCQCSKHRRNSKRNWKSQKNNKLKKWSYYLNTLVEKIKVIENKLFNVESDPEIIEVQEKTFKCKDCDFIGKNEKGLNIHMRRKKPCTKF